MNIVLQLLLFLASVSLGAVLSALYILAAWFAKHTQLKVVCYVFDVLWCTLAAVSYAALILVLANGVFMLFTLSGLLGGLLSGLLVFSKNAKTNKEKLL